VNAVGILREILERYQRPVITDHDLKLMIRRLYAGLIQTPTPYQHSGAAPSPAVIARIIDGLRRDRVIRDDPDFGPPVHQVFDVLDQSAEAVCAEVDPFSYISHQSALQRFGLSDRNPVALVLTTPDVALWREECDRLIPEELAGLPFSGTPPRRRRIGIPEQVRKRPILVHETKHPGAWRRMADSRVRLATIGQTFVDTITRPSWCGGMNHVLEVWDRHADLYRDEIIAAVEACPYKLVKVRAGHLLSERLGIADARIDAWHQFAQRGSSQKLDPERPYAPSFSEHWMLSLNA